MRVTVKLFATLQKDRFGVIEGEFPEGTTVGDIVRHYGVPEKDVTLIFINGRHGEFETGLSDGDTLALFPPVGGG
ncbi:MAG TPA: MoaD/ThiS family protein [Syntrophorhabdaceae bacterium]|nr:MoaD/ThiS family protein [Syntrophorhabdaceae bacterium]